MSCAERRAQAGTELACIPEKFTLPVWRASVRMALVSTAGLVAASSIGTGMAGCADMSGIAPQASLRDAAPLGRGLCIGADLFAAHFAGLPDAPDAPG